MALSASTTSIYNLSLALERINRGSNREYKQCVRHLYPSVSLSQSALIQRISDELKRGTYEPAPPTTLYQPKKSGIPRPKNGPQQG
jgi:hypothetical protein